MAKTAKQSKSSKPSLIWIIAGLIVAAVIFGAINLNNGQDTATITLITPDRYVEEISLLGHTLVDVRTPEEYAEGHIEGSVNIPLDDLPARMAELGKADNVVLYCRSGNRSDQAAQLLLAEGYGSIYDLGGIIDWDAAGYPLVMD